MGCVYILTSPSGKSYIGISRYGLERRWAKHVEHAIGKRDSGALYAALRKYGPQSFERMVLAECDDFSKLCEMERAAIQEYRTLSPSGYNLTLGGEGTCGPISDAARQNVSVAQKKRFADPVQRAALLDQAARGRAAHSVKAAVIREKKKAERAAYLSSDAFKKLRSIAIKRAMARPEVAAKMLACAKDRVANPDWRLKIAATKRGKKIGPCSQERKDKIAAARRREWADPMMREKRLAALAAARRARSGA